MANFIIPAIGAVASIIGSSDQSAANAAAQTNAQNNAASILKSSGQLASSQQLSAYMNMMQQYQQYLNQNPNPAQTWQGIQQPQALAAPGGSIGGGQIGSNGSPVGHGGGQGQQMRQVMPQQQQAPAQNLGGMFGQQAPQQGQAMPGGQQTSSPSMGVPLTYLQNYFGGNKVAS